MTDVSSYRIKQKHPRNRVEAPSFSVKQEADSKARNKRIGRAILGSVLAIGTLLGVSTLLNKQDHDVHARHAKKEIEAIESLNNDNDVALNQVAVLFEGAAIRKTPTAGNEVAFQVKKGEVLRIDRPRLYQDGEQQWLSFTDYDKGNPDGGANDPKRTFWVDLTDMQNSTNMHLIQMYNYPEKAFPISLSEELPVTINSHNQAVASIGKADVPVGQASTMPAGSFDQLASAEGLKPAQ